MTKKLLTWLRRLWCALHDHGGITPFDETKMGVRYLCKRCGGKTYL